MPRLPLGRLVLAALAFAAAAHVLVKNAWIGEDCFITYRAIDNMIQGYGPNWNVGERVQVYTHPLWMLLLAAQYAYTHEAFYGTIAVSLSCSTGVLLVAAVTLWRERRPAWAFALFTMVLLSSKAFVDYSSSGLENPLSHLIAIAFFALIGGRADARREGCRAAALVGLTSLAFITRADTVLVYALPVGIVALRTLARMRARGAMVLLAGATPASLWLAFATVYYGFPLPNTAYAKLNGLGPTVLFHENAGYYFLNSLKWDPATLPVTLALLAVAITQIVRGRDRRRGALYAASGAALYLFYVVRIGGDYMSGRFFSLPLLVLAFHAARTVDARVVAAALATLAAILSLRGPRTPAFAKLDYEPLRGDPTTIRDERGEYNETLGFRSVYERKKLDPGRTDTLLGFRVARPKVIVWGAVGYFGFTNGPDVVAVDHLGLTDPLLARLPSPDAERGWGRGHLMRTPPVGYLTSLETGHNVIADPEVHDLYADLRRATRGAVLDPDRAGAILRLNRGKRRR